MGDRLLRGTLAGAIAEVACIVNNYLLEVMLGFAKTRWVKMLSYLVYGRPIVTTADWILGYFLCFFTGGLLGFLYARFMQPRPNDGNYYFRAVALGWGFMIFAYTLGNLFRVPAIQGIAWQTVVTTLISSTAWGIVVGYLMKRWDTVYR